EVLPSESIIDRDTNRSKGFGFVEMADGADEAANALNGQDYRGRNLTVNEARPREDRGRGGYGGGGGGRGGCGCRGGVGRRWLRWSLWSRPPTPTTEHEALRGANLLVQVGPLTLM